MILADTSVWVDHLRGRNTAVVERVLLGELMIMHPFVIGEIALGNFPHRAEVLARLKILPMAPLVPHAEILSFIERHRLMGRGIGYVDTHLLAATGAAAQTQLWTRDKRLARAAADLGLVHHA
ncbi:MAG: PIN domain-containing protein [Gammaproteobacteria bacterium]